MRYASARGLAMRAIFKNYLSNQTGDVIVNPGNPENPDSNQWQLRAYFPLRLRELLVFWGCFLKIILNQDLQDYEDYRGRLRF